MKMKCACLVSSLSQLILRVKPRPSMQPPAPHGSRVRRDDLGHTPDDLGQESLKQPPSAPWLRCLQRSGVGSLCPPASPWRHRQWAPQKNRAGTQQAGCWLRIGRRGSFDDIINSSPPAWGMLRASFAGGEGPLWGPLCTPGVARSIYHSPFDVFQMACTAAVSTRNHFITFSDVTGKARLEPPFGC